MPDPSQWIPQPTQDGSFTFFSAEFGESFHSNQGAKEEALNKYATATRLAQKAQQPTLRLLDVCYGLGYNSAAALETIWAINSGCRVELYSLELDASVPQAAIASGVMAPWAEPIPTLLTDLALTHRCTSDRLHAHLLIGDARQTIQVVQQSGLQADAIFLDPFSPRRCPQLWTVEFLRLVAQCLAPTGIIATYSRAASVRSALRSTGLSIGSIPLPHSTAPHEWSQGTVAGFEAQFLPPLSQLEQEHLQTRAAVPYRDPSLTDTADEILDRHRQEQQTAEAESTSSWRRRWGIR